MEGLLKTITPYLQYAPYIIPPLLGLGVSWIGVRSIRIYRLEENKIPLKTWQVRGCAFLLATVFTSASWFGLNGRDLTAVYDGLIYGSTTGILSPAIWARFVDYMRKNNPDSTLLKKLHPANKG